VIEERNNLPTLPKGWVWEKLGQIAERLNPGFPSGKHNKENRGIPHMRPMNISAKGEIDFSDVKYVEVNDYDTLLNGDVLFNNTNSPELLGKTSYIKQNTNWAYSNHMTRIRLNHDYINSAWIAYWLHYLFLVGFFKMSCVHHVNQASINTSFLAEKVQIPVPPLPEQQRIVAKIEELFTRLDAGVEALKKIKTQIKRYRQAVLKYAFEGKLTAEWREKHKDELEPASVLLEKIKEEKKKTGNNKYRALPPVDISGQLIPSSWTWASTSEVCDSVRDGTHDTPQYIKNGIPLITSKNLKVNGLDFSSANNISIEDHKKIIIRSNVDSGDILFAMIGTIGNPIVVRKDREFSIKNVALFKKNESFLKPEYLMYWLKSSVFYQILENKKLLKGTTQKFIPLEHLRILPIPLSSRLEQAIIIEEIERRFSVADEIEKVIDQSLKQAERLRQSILKGAFEGKLVPQDPSDEPAEKFLERIKAERESREAEGNAQKKGKKKKDNAHGRHK